VAGKDFFHHGIKINVQREKTENYKRPFSLNDLMCHQIRSQKIVKKMSGVIRWWYAQQNAEQSLYIPFNSINCLFAFNSVSFFGREAWCFVVVLITIGFFSLSPLSLSFVLLFFYFRKYYCFDCNSLE